MIWTVRKPHCQPISRTSDASGRTERRQDFADRSRRVRDEGLPNVDGKLSDWTADILTGDENSAENAIASFLAQDFDERDLDLSSLNVVLVFSLRDFGFAGDAGDLEEQLADELHRAVRVSAPMQGAGREANLCRMR